MIEPHSDLDAHPSAKFHEEIRSAKFGLKMAFSVMQFRNEATTLKSETHNGSANNWSISSSHICR